MITLSYGIKKPEQNDQGSVLFSALESNFQLQNDHSHNGTNSVKIDSSAFTVITQAISSASWVETPAGSGTYKQKVTMPVGLTFDLSAVTLKNASTGDPLALTVNKFDNTSYEVFINDSSLSLVANYGL
jgi:hypothetical protein